MTVALPASVDEVLRLLGAHDYIAGRLTKDSLPRLRGRVRVGVIS